MIPWIRNWIRNMWTNHRREFIAASILLFSIVVVGLLWIFGSNNSTTEKLPGGGAVIFLIAVLATIGAVVRNNNRGLWIIAGFLWIFWLYPKVMPLLSLWGIVPGIALLLFIALAWWIVKSKRIGLFGYRLILAAILLFSAIEAMPTIINNGVSGLKQVLSSVTLPNGPSSTKIGNATGKFVGAFVTKVEASADQTAVTARQDSQIQKTWRIKPDVKIYDCSSGTSCIPMPLEYSVETEVISLGSPVEINGVSYEKCSLPDAATKHPGTWTGWIRSVNLVPKPEPPKLDASAECGAEKLVATLPPAGMTIDKYPLEIWLDAGKYRLEPKNSGMQISQIRLVQAGEKNYKNLEDGEKFTNPIGQIVAVRTDWPEVKIYRKG